MHSHVKAETKWPPFTYGIFKSILINEKFVSKDPINKEQSSVQMMTLCRINDKPLFEPFMVQFTDAYVPRWVDSKKFVIINMFCLSKSLLIHMLRWRALLELPSWDPILVKSQPLVWAPAIRDSRYYCVGKIYFASNFHRDDVIMGAMATYVGGLMIHFSSTTSHLVAQKCRDLVAQKCPAQK